MDALVDDEKTRDAVFRDLSSGAHLMKPRHFKIVRARFFTLPNSKPMGVWVCWDLDSLAEPEPPVGLKKLCKTMFDMVDRVILDAEMKGRDAVFIGWKHLPDGEKLLVLDEDHEKNRAAVQDYMAIQLYDLQVGYIRLHTENDHDLESCDSPDCSITGVNFQWKRGASIKGLDKYKHDPLVQLLAAKLKLPHQAAREPRERSERKHLSIGRK